MPILQDVTITLTVEELLETQGRKETRPAFVAAAEKAIALGETLLAPVAIYDEFEVRDVTSERVELAVDAASSHDVAAASLTGSAGLTVGPMSHLLAPAQRLLLGVYTIGTALEARVRELHRAGEPLLSYLLDCVGVMAVGVVGGRLGRLAEERAAAASSRVRSGPLHHVYVAAAAGA